MSQGPTPPKPPAKKATTKVAPAAPANIKPIIEEAALSDYAHLNLRKKVALAELNPHPENPRTHPPQGSEEWNILVESLKHDYFDPIVWNERNGFLVSGHLRRKVLLSLGYHYADIVVVDYDEPTHIARMFAANENIGKNDKAKAKLLLSRLDEDQSRLTGMLSKNREKLLGRGEEEVSQEPTYPITPKLGEKHDYVVIYVDNETDRAFLHSLLEIRKERSFKSTSVGTGRVVTFRRFMEALVKNKTSI